MSVTVRIIGATTPFEGMRGIMPKLPPMGDKGWHTVQVDIMGDGSEFVPVCYKRVELEEG
jgi:hypothetical protein